MKNLLVNSLEEKQQIEWLLDKELPNHRKAYSDRTCWLMACLAELAYVKFNPVFKSTSKTYFIKKVISLVDKNKEESLYQLIDLVGYDPEKEKQQLIDNIQFLKLTLVDTFDSDGTQAILLKNKDYLFLSFRGTEPTSINDVKSDLRATTEVCESGGKIHSGFNDAFNCVAVEIQEKIEQEGAADLPLFISGHSLGGALATIAAKKLKHKGGIAACYTFGSPRVGDAEWAESIKTPIYRIVNAADPVTMLPPGKDVIDIVSWTVGKLPYIGKTTKHLLLSKFGGYLHVGDMRYLTNCTDKQLDEVKLLYSVNLFYRLKAWSKRKLPFLKLPSDHSMPIYRQKLNAIAKRRN